MMPRRIFLQMLLAVPGFYAIAKSLGPKTSWADDLKLIDMTGKKRTDAANKTAVSVAQNLKYMDDGSKNPKRKAPDAACGNCQFFTAKGDGGTCLLIQGVLVNKKGYCDSWVKKA